MTYFEGFIVPVPEANRDAYRKHANDVAPLFQEFGVHRFVEAWDSDVPEGKVTDFRKAVDAKPDEKVVFSWFEYPDKAARDAANEKMMSDPRMEEMGADMPFDGKRMIIRRVRRDRRGRRRRRRLCRRLRRPGPGRQARSLSRARRENGQGVPPARRQPGDRSDRRRRARTARSPTSIAR